MMTAKQGVGCICGQTHDVITQEQIIAAETRKPLGNKGSDPFPDLPGNSTVDCGTRWHKGGVLLSDEAAARCITPEELNREEARAESELLRHVKAGLRTPGVTIPPWARGLCQDPSEATPGPQRPL